MVTVHTGPVLRRPNGPLRVGVGRTTQGQPQGSYLELAHASVAANAGQLLYVLTRYLPHFVAGLAEYDNQASSLTSLKYTWQMAALSSTVQGLYSEPKSQPTDPPGVQVVCVPGELLSVVELQVDKVPWAQWIPITRGKMRLSAGRSPSIHVGLQQADFFLFCLRPAVTSDKRSFVAPQDRWLLGQVLRSHYDPKRGGRAEQLPAAKIRKVVLVMTGMVQFPPVAGDWLLIHALRLASPLAPSQLGVMAGVGPHLFRIMAGLAQLSWPMPAALARAVGLRTEGLA